MATRKDPPKLSELEWEIMKPLWDSGPMAARDVYQAVPEEHIWSYRTLKTMLSRLVGKGALGYEQIGSSYRYHAVHTREEMTCATMKAFVDRVFDGAPQPFMTHFAGSLDKDGLEALRSELARAARKPKKGADEVPG
ncbi:MAG: BlaI/MecI/CopY family transcriptional regulator [Candidatus Hydrogenedentes bacterium]|nr:BlaI/MecI/CopY family transcriptional regulator [Candidatus Hydrogenedentota bacterium]